jgi:hypothetical protein
MGDCFMAAFAGISLRVDGPLQRFPFIWDHSVIPYERETP